MLQEIASMILYEVKFCDTLLCSSTSNCDKNYLLVIMEQNALRDAVFYLSCDMIVI